MAERKKLNPPIVPTNPKVFVSYAWTSPAHCDQIRSYADRLLADGVEVIIDQYDLAEGQDKYHFMERMVTDPSVTHVLVFSDSVYTAKADLRKAGVGTETQIISKEVYDQVEQMKFVPVFCELDEAGEYCVPRFFKTRIGFDFTSSDRVNENWEKLIRFLFGKPALIKPAVGKPPEYLKGETIPVSPSAGKLASYKAAVLAGRPALILHRQEFLSAALDYAESLKEPLDDEERVFEILRALLPLRDQLIEWISLEVSIAPNDESGADVLISFLERLLPLKYYRPEPGDTFCTWWADAQMILVHEVFLYLVALLLENGRFPVLRIVMQTPFLFPEEAHRNNTTTSYEVFGGHSEMLHRRNERLELRRLSMIADLIKERATRRDISFKSIMQADAVLFVHSMLSGNARWYPDTLGFAEYGGTFPLFVRAMQKRYFEKLSVLFGGGSAEELKGKIVELLPSIRGYQVLRYVSLEQILEPKKWATVD